MNYEKRRERMVKKLVREGRIGSSKVIEAMKAVPREEFVPSEVRRVAYHDSPQRIGEGQTISAPHMVGMMVEALDMHEGETVLEVGGGSGYHAAITAEIVGEGGHVYSVEYVAALAKRARENLDRAGVGSNITMVHGDGSKGYPKYAPYDKIFVACAAPAIPPPLIEQVKVGGKILIPVGERYYSKLTLATKTDEGEVETEDMGGCAFVPLLGEYGHRAA